MLRYLCQQLIKQVSSAMLETVKTSFSNSLLRHQQWPTTQQAAHSRCAFPNTQTRWRRGDEEGNDSRGDVNKWAFSLLLPRGCQYAQFRIHFCRMLQSILKDGLYRRQSKSVYSIPLLMWKKNQLISFVCQREISRNQWMVHIQIRVRFMTQILAFGIKDVCFCRSVFG